MVQLNNDKISNADIVALPSGVAFLMANSNALAAKSGLKWIGCMV
jgi:hypothetical protein